MDYRRHNVDLLRQHGDIASKRVLEIGGDSRGETARMLLEAGAREVVVTNVGHGISTGQLSEAISFRKIDARRLHEAFPPGHFDAAFGVAVAEHIPDPAAWTESLAQVMAPGGHALVHGGPIWSGPHGHHVWVSIEGVDYRFTDKSNPLAAWDHLLHDQVSLAAYLVAEKAMPASHAAAVAHFVYVDANINRVPYSRLCAEMGSGGMALAEVYPNIYRRPDAAMAERLAASPLGPQESYEVSGAAFLLRRR
ncbi:methyltransferase domain-containing protein [Roseomonas sp. CAU 1739]|uniref:class I SAM-dependent methyltransferase n=1 Tax=Roseomonas sp. CAU 1739 TaxID=3140364 RepID=UPI00325BA841